MASDTEGLLIELRDRLFLTAIACVREYPNTRLMDAADREIGRLLDEIDRLEGLPSHDPT